MEAVPAAGRPAGHDADDDLRHEADEALHLEDVEAAGLGGIDGVGGVAVRVAVAVLAADALVAAGAERPAAVLRRGAVAGEEHAADVGGLSGVVEHSVELVHRRRPEGVAHLGPVERDAHRAVGLRPVVGDVRQVEARNVIPGVGVEELGDHGARVRARAPAGLERARASRRHLREPHRQHRQGGPGHRRRSHRAGPADESVPDHRHRLPGAVRRRPGDRRELGRRADRRGATPRSRRVASRRCPRSSGKRAIVYLTYAIDPGHALQKMSDAVAAGARRCSGGQLIRRDKLQQGVADFVERVLDVTASA